MSLNIFTLTGKVALVTGATGYLGREMCIALAESGAHVLVNSRNAQRATKLVNYLNEEGYSAESAVFDICLDDELKCFFEIWGNKTIDIIINNAYAGKGGTIETSTSKEYMSAYEISITATHNLIVHALPNLRQAVRDNGYSSIINIASMYGVVSPDLSLYSNPESSNPPFYGVAKAALIQFTKYAACEFGKENIRVNSISPGPFPNKETNKPEFIRVLSKKVPLGRVGDAAELKGPIIFLASEASSFINGENLVVDGGWTIW